MSAISTIRTVLGRRLGRTLVMAGLAVAMTTGATAGSAAAASVAAATLTTGQHTRAAASCDMLSGRMLVHLPQVGSVPLSQSNVVTIGGWTGGGNHPQWVGVRVWLLRWDAAAGRWAYTDQNRDGYYDHLPLLQTRVLSDMNVLGSDWWNADAGRSMAVGDTQLPIRYSGFYKLNVEYFWYADQYVGAGYDVLESVDHFVTLYTTVSKPYCTY